MSRLNGLYIVVAASCIGISACSGDQGASAAPVAAKKSALPPRETVVTTPAGAYRAVAVTEGGSISGSVQLAPGTPVLAQPVVDSLPAGCAPPDRVSATPGGLNGAVVWLTDIRTGKGFPLERRVDMVNENCNIAPQVQTVFAGETINVGSNDAVLHHNRFINVATGEAEAVAPFNDKGEIVPFDRLLTKTAQYEIVCDVHPWTRAWLLVVDHPYFAETGGGGGFSITDVPAGTYHIRAWHPSFGVADGTVTVSAGAAASVTLTIGPRSAPSSSPAASSTSSGT
jgi:hypothetical protein